MCPVLFLLFLHICHNDTFQVIKDNLTQQFRNVVKAIQPHQTPFMEKNTLLKFLVIQQAMAS